MVVSSSEEVVMDLDLFVEVVIVSNVDADDDDDDDGDDMWNTSTRLGCSIEPTIKVEGDFGSKTGRKVLNHLPVMLSCLMKVLWESLLGSMKFVHDRIVLS